MAVIQTGSETIVGHLIFPGHTHVFFLYLCLNSVKSTRFIPDINRS